MSTNLECQFCHKIFDNKSSYSQHSCTSLKRHEQLKTLIGQNAWNYYRHWHVINNRQTFSKETFIKSRYYKSFVKFAVFVKKFNLPIPTMFIEFMKQKNMQPSAWTNYELYLDYVAFLDREATPALMIQITINTIEKLKDKYNVEENKLFDVVPVHEIIDLMRKRQLSLWVLLYSKSFKKMIFERANSSEKTIFGTLILPDFWKDKFKKNTKVVTIIKDIVKELEL